MRLLVVLFVISFACTASGQTQTAAVQRAAKLIGELSHEGRVRNVQWNDDGAAVTFVRGGKKWEVDLATYEVRNSAKSTKSKTAGNQTPHHGGVPRGSQHVRVASPDGKWIAVYRDGNLFLESAPSVEEKDNAGTPVTIAVTDNGTKHLRYGNACWVYGEELFQSSAIWWSSDSRKAAFYETDERQMQDYHLTSNNTSVYPSLHTVRYPTAGQPNPIVGMLIYDLESKQTTRVNVGQDKQQYIYRVQFAPNANELLFHRLNRRQDRLEVVAADLQTGETRIVVAESQETWQNNLPLFRFLKDGQRFVWETERNGWKQYELRHIDGRLLNPLTNEVEYPVASLLKLDEQNGLLYYSAFSDDQPYCAQLHRVRLDGTDLVRLTQESLNHTSINISPDGKWFTACREAVGVPPVTSLYNAEGNIVATLAEADQSKIDNTGLIPPELFRFKANDGETDLYGVLYKPTKFDPAKKYPLVVSVYGGPFVTAMSNRYLPGAANCEHGFLIAKIANRGTVGRSKKFETATYLKLGDVDLQDQVDGVTHLCQREYVDSNRVGIYGHSYGGYMSALAIVKHPDTFHVAVAGAAIADWKNYDTIYTERYMRTPAENPEGYKNGSALTYAKNLKGKLLLMHGLMDDNVHPGNVWQLANALQKENRPFDMMIYPQSKHGLGGNSESIKWEYLVEHLR